MKVHFYATFRPLVGTKTVEIPLPASGSLRALVREVVTRYPPLGPLLLADDGELAHGIHVFINGRGAGYLPDKLETTVAADDVIDIFPAVAGG